MPSHEHPQPTEPRPAAAGVMTARQVAAAGIAGEGAVREATAPRWPSTGAGRRPVIPTAPPRV